MSSTTKVFIVLGAVLPLLTGCIVVVADDGSWHMSGPRVEVKQTEERVLETAGLTELDVATHNGAIDFAGQDAGAGSIKITKEARGTTQEDAQEAMDAIEVFVESKGGKTSVGWKWNVPKKTRWQGEVSFTIRGPRMIDFDAETHNGAITIGGVDGDVSAETHNGEITVNSTTGTLDAETHNGEIQVTYAGPKVTLTTHNGEVVADLSRCGAVTGDVTTHNGGVRVSVGDGTSADVRCTTANGEVRADAPLSNVEKSRGRLSGTLGAGGGKLDVTTHNGEIRIKKPNA